MKRWPRQSRVIKVSAEPQSALGLSHAHASTHDLWRILLSHAKACQRPPRPLGGAASRTGETSGRASLLRVERANVFVCVRRHKRDKSHLCDRRAGGGGEVKDGAAVESVEPKALGAQKEMSRASALQ